MDNSNKDKAKSKRVIAFSRIKRQILSHVWVVRIVILSAILALILILGIFTYKGIADSKIGTFIGLAHNFIFPSSENLSSSSGNVNILVMGKSGPGHDGPDLTDTMILVSVSTTTHKVTLVSIPRDIWMDDLKAKINAAYYYGNLKQPGGGLVLAKSTVEEVLGIPINYAVVVDFNGFKDVIDALGGVQINVKTGFTDTQYPITGKENDTCNGDRTYACRYETVTFKPGLQFMTGDTALIFVRSRHGDNNEGDDIHREARQQLVIGAILKKILTVQVLTSLSKINMLVTIANKNIETDLTISQEITLSRLVIDGRNSLKSYTIPTELLFTPPIEAKYLNQFVYIPKKGLTDWTDIQKWVKSVLP